MDGEGGIGSPLLKKVIELASHVVVLGVRVKRKKNSWQANFLNLVFLITLPKMIART
jgi:hypothetical protein